MKAIGSRLVLETRSSVKTLNVGSSPIAATKIKYASHSLVGKAQPIGGLWMEGSNPSGRPNKIKTMKTIKKIKSKR